MLKRIVLPTILLVLAFGFWVSPNFKTIAAGVAIFLFGMLSLEEGFRAFTGGGLEQLLRRTTATTGRSILFGIVSTTLMQSSSLVSVITISFLSAGLITLTAGIGIVFGANLGTTTGAWLVAGFGLKVDIAAYAMPMLAFGVVLIFQSSESLKGIGYILSGLGFLFLGIHYMKDGFEAFKETIDLAQYAVPGYAGVALFTAIGLFATVVMQSSHATLVLTITALAANQITYENALALAIGANIGTTITALLGSMSANENGKRLAAAHLVFNMVTGIIAIIFIYQLVALVDGISATIGIASDDYTLKLAVFHSVFNLLGIVVMLPLLTSLVANLEKLISEKKSEVDQPKYLTESSSAFPGTAVEAVRMETLRVYEAALRIIMDGLGMKRAEVLSTLPLEPIVAAQTRIHSFDIDAMYERHIKAIYSAIVGFISDENPEIRRAYDRIRVRIAQTIRELEEMREAGGGAMDVLALDALKLLVGEEKKAISQVTTELVAQRIITPSMGSSLINDSVFANVIAMNLLQAAQVLFVTRERDLTQAVHDVVLDRSELNRIEQRTDGVATN